MFRGLKILALFVVLADQMAFQASWLLIWSSRIWAKGKKASLTNGSLSHVCESARMLRGPVAAGIFVKCLEVRGLQVESISRPEVQGKFSRGLGLLPSRLSNPQT